MKKNLHVFSETGTKLYVPVLILFAAATAFFGLYYLAAAELSIILLLLVINAFQRRSREKKLAAYIESLTYDTENAKNNTLVNFPLPITVFRLNDSGIVWGNESFFEICGIHTNRLDAKIDEAVKGFTGKWLAEGKSSYPGLVEVSGRQYRIFGNLIRSDKEHEDTAFMGICYWVDVTGYENIKRKYEMSRPCASIIVIDNLEELCRNQPDRIKNDIRDEIEDKLSSWIDENGGIFKRFERDRYLAIFEKHSIDQLRDGKFDIIQQIHSVTSPTGIEASFSIGIGYDAETLADALQFASTGVELALSRGGDQVVIKNRLSFEFFGGRGNEIEKRTKVKSRVMANTLFELMRESSGVYVMGHRMADLDAVGASVGICCVARKAGVPCKIVLEKGKHVSEPLVDRLLQDKLYEDAFISPSDALLKADGKTLLVVVDTNRPEAVEDLQLLQACNRVAVIDHHRVTASHIQNAALGFVEPYASSACELLTEIIQEVTEPSDLAKCEAEALLAGMVLDTKSFSLRTGERTFEAAAYLRRAGADTVAVKRFMQTDVKSTLSRYSIIQKAEVYKDVVIAITDAPNDRVTLAKAADEMLNISGIEASIAAAPDTTGSINVSARSIGDLNVQILMEKIGGGGNRSAAAACFKDETVENVILQIHKAIDEYFE